MDSVAVAMAKTDSSNHTAVLNSSVDESEHTTVLNTALGTIPFSGSILRPFSDKASVDCMKSCCIVEVSMLSSRRFRTVPYTVIVFRANMQLCLGPFFLSFFLQKLCLWLKNHLSLFDFFYEQIDR